MRRVLGWGVVLLFVAVNLGACASMGGGDASGGALALQASRWAGRHRRSGR